MDPLPSGCEHALNKLNSSEDARQPASALLAPSTPAEVTLPAVEKKDVRGPVVAEVSELKGKAWLKPLSGHKEALKSGVDPLPWLKMNPDLRASNL